MTEYQHPLTDEICEEIAPWLVQDPGVYDCMRTAAEWQLIQVIQFLEANKDLSVKTALRFIRPAMRPQQQS